MRTFDAINSDKISEWVWQIKMVNGNQLIGSMTFWCVHDIFALSAAKYVKLFSTSNLWQNFISSMPRCEQGRILRERESEGEKIV